MNTLLAALLIGLPFFGGFGRSAQIDKPIRIQLTGAEESPQVGSAEGSGTAHITFDEGKHQICYELRATDIDLPAAGAHIHKAAFGEVGPVVVRLEPPDASGYSADCEYAENDLIGDIMNNPEDYYINIQTPGYPTGALRGQMGAKSSE
jgi:hypothetical protein